jgi:hypothetical protein
MDLLGKIETFFVVLPGGMGLRDEDDIPLAKLTVVKIGPRAQHVAKVAVFWRDEGHLQKVEWIR